jgi:56kDa selenium binding protein (SBP56)
VPGLRSSNIHVLDTQPDPRNPRPVKTITGKELSAKAGYSRPHAAPGRPAMPLVGRPQMVEVSRDATADIARPTIPTGMRLMMVQAGADNAYIELRLVDDW